MKRTFTLGRYLCVERLGDGPLGGETWRAKLYSVAGVERQCTLERLPAHWVAEPGFLERFASATQAYLNLEHPGLMPLHEVGQEGQEHYLVWDLPAGDLTHIRVAAQALLHGGAGEDLAEAGATLGVSLAQTLAYVHARGALHLGLCPQSVHLDGTGRVRVSHVGLLRPCQLGPWTERPEVRHVLGYLAPEVLRTQSVEIDARADVYSVGALLYEWVTGAPAFTGASPAALLAQMMRGPAPASTTTAKGALSGPAAALMQVAQRALQPGPADRYRTMAELLDALRAVPVIDREARSAAVIDRTIAQRALKRLARQLARRSGSDPLHSADPLPPPPAPSTDEAKGFVPPPAQVFVPSASSDVLRDMQISGPISLSPQRSAEGLAALGDESGPVTLGRRPQQGAPQQQIPEQRTVPARPSFKSPDAAGLPGVRPPRAGVSSFALEEEESTVPVPHSPRSRIVVIEAEPPAARPDSGETGSRAGGTGQSGISGISGVPGLGLLQGLRGHSEETPLPVSIPMPPDSEPGTGSWPSLKDPSTRPGGKSGTPPGGTGRPTARLGGGQQVGDEPRKRGPGRPAGFAEFDEPTALADYDTALASLVGMSSDRSDAVPVPNLSSGPSSSLDSGPTKLYRRSDIQIPPSVAARQAAEAASQRAPVKPAPAPAAPDPAAQARALAEQYAPLITGEVPKARPEDLAAPAEDLIVPAEDLMVAEERPTAAPPPQAIAPERSMPSRPPRPPATPAPSTPSGPSGLSRPSGQQQQIPAVLKDHGAVSRPHQTPLPTGLQRAEQVSNPLKSRRLPGARPSQLNQIVPLTAAPKESTPPRAVPGRDQSPPGIPLPGKALPTPAAIAVPSVEMVTALAAAVAAATPVPSAPAAAPESPAPVPVPAPKAPDVKDVPDAPPIAVDPATTAVTAPGAAVTPDEHPAATGSNGVSKSARSPDLDRWSTSHPVVSLLDQPGAASHDSAQGSGAPSIASAQRSAVPTIDALPLEKPVVDAPLTLPDLPSGIQHEVEAPSGVRNPLVIALVAGFVGALVLGGGASLGYRWLAARQKPAVDDSRAVHSGLKPPPGPLVAQQKPAQTEPPTPQPPGPVPVKVPGTSGEPEVKQPGDKGPDKAAAKPETKPGDKGQTKPETKPEDKGEVKPGDKGESKPETKPGDKGEVKPGDKGEVKPGDKGETKPEDKGETKPETKPGDKGQPKPGDKGEPAETPEVPVKETAPGGMLTVAAAPVAVAFLDGKPAGKTPAVLRLSAGMHRLVLVAEKHRLWDQQIQAGEPMKVKLEQIKLPQKALPGWTNIKVRCQGKIKLRVFLDGQDTGLSCPAQRLNVPPGPHEVGVRDPITGETRTQSVVLKPGPKAAKVTVKF